jgi:hypothetical protein
MRRDYRDKGLTAVLSFLARCGFQSASRADLPPTTIVTNGEVQINYDGGGHFRR